MIERRDISIAMPGERNLYSKEIDASRMDTPLYGGETASVYTCKYILTNEPAFTLTRSWRTQFYDYHLYKTLFLHTSTMV